MDLFGSSELFIIEASVILIISFLFGEISKRTSIPSVLLLIILGVGVNLVMDAFGVNEIDFFPVLKLLGTVGLIMIVLEAALELKLSRDKLIPILLSLGIALVGLLLSTWVTAEILHYAIDFSSYGSQSKMVAWLYATPLSILSSAIIIPSVIDLRADKKEFHIYESTFSDILGIMLFYYLESQISLEGAAHASNGGVGGFAITTLLTVLVSFFASYLLVFIFQGIRSTTKLFLLISSLLLIYALGKQMHLSSLLIILIFGLVVANMDLFFVGPLKKWLNKKEAHQVYHGLHTITMETAFVVRTFFFVVFGITIEFSSLASWSVIGLSAVLLAVIYIIRLALLSLSIGRDINPQLYIAPRGLITILLFYKIPKELAVEGFSTGILLFIILGTSLVMTFSLIANKRRASRAIRDIEALNIGEAKWKAPEV